MMAMFAVCLVWFCAECAQGQIIILGRRADDRFLTNFWGQNGNSTNLVGMVTAVSDGTVRFGDHLLPTTISNKTFSGTFTGTNTFQLQVWDSVAAALTVWDFRVTNSVPQGTNTVSRVGFPETLTYKALNNFTAQASGSNLDGVLKANGSDYVSAISGSSGTNTIYWGTNYITLIDGVVTAYGGTNMAGIGVSTLNGLTASSQTLATNASGNDFSIASSTSTHTFSLPTASASSRGALSAADWTSFNSKQSGDSTLTALAAYNDNGLLTQVGPDTFVARRITAASTNVIVTNGDGISGDISIDLNSTNNPAAILTAKGDLLGHDGTNLVRKAVGTDGHVLTADSAVTNGWKWAAVTVPTAANPTASIGLAAVNGAASTFMRSDGAPALDQSISPTWTGFHSYRGNEGATSIEMRAISSATGNTDHKGSPNFNVQASIWNGATSVASPMNIRTEGWSGADSVFIGTFAVSTNRLRVDNLGNVSVGPEDVLSTTTTNGFLYINSVAGTPTGVPGVAWTGHVPIIYDGSNNRLYAYNSGWQNLSASAASGANPSASVGLTAVNGAAATFMRSDGAPALDVSIAPTWTGVHTFDGSLRYGTGTTTYAASVSVDFNGKPFQTITLTGDLDIATTNRGAGRTVTVRLIGDSVNRNLTFNASIRFVGAEPTELVANKIAILTLTSFGSNESDTVASYAEEP